MQNIVKTDRSRQSYVIAPPMTIFLGLVLAALLFFPNGEQALALSTQTEPAPMPINTLIELNSQDPTEMKSAIDFIESTGATTKPRSKVVIHTINSLQESGIVG